jgi:predicted nucleic acid-binding protein
LNRLVVDASVVLKWYLPTEAYGEIALALLHRYIRDDVGLIGPSLLEYEVVNGLVIARRRGRIEEEKVLAAIEGFFDLGIPLLDLSTL